MKSAPFAILALIAVAVLAPAASADSGTLVVDNTSFAVSSYTITSNQLDVKVNSSVLGNWFFLIDQLTGADLNNLELIADGTTHDFHSAHVIGFGLSGSPSGIISDVDFVYINSTAVPEPASFVLLAWGLAGLAFAARRKLLLS
jgi:hypothetical protein